MIKAFYTKVIRLEGKTVQVPNGDNLSSEEIISRTTPRKSIDALNKEYTKKRMPLPVKDDGIDAITRKDEEDSFRGSLRSVVLRKVS